MNIYVYVYVIIYIYIDIYTCIYMNMYVHVYTCIYMHLYTCIYTYTCTHIYTYLCIYIYVHMYTYMYMTWQGLQSRDICKYSPLTRHFVRMLCREVPPSRCTHCIACLPAHIRFLFLTVPISLALGLSPFCVQLMPDLLA